MGKGPPHESRVLGWLLIWKAEALGHFGLVGNGLPLVKAQVSQQARLP